MKNKKSIFSLILACLLAASVTVPTSVAASGYGKKPAYEAVEVEKKGGGENANSLSIDEGLAEIEAGEEEEITELSGEYEGTNDNNMIVAAPDALSPGAFRKLAQNGLDYAVEIKAPETEDVIARYVVKADQAAKMRKTVRLTSKALSDEILTEVQRQLGDAYIASAFYSTQLFGNVLVNAYVNVQVKANGALEDMLAQGKKPVVYKVNENTGKLTKYAVDAVYENGFISFDIQKGDSYVISAEDAIGEYEVITEAPAAEEEAAEEAAEETAEIEEGAEQEEEQEPAEVVSGEDGEVVVEPDEAAEETSEASDVTEETSEGDAE